MSRLSSASAMKKQKAFYSKSILSVDNREWNKEENGAKGTKIPLIVHFSTFMMLASGVLSVTSFKMQGTKYNFKHGFFQVFLMFVGEWINLIIFGSRMLDSKVREDNFKQMKEECKITK